jgi:aminopeptidase N
MSLQRPSAVLTQHQAERRKACINSDKGISYTTFYDFDKGDHYRGLIEIAFFFIGGEDVFLDFTGDKIVYIKANNVTVEIPQEEDLGDSPEAQEIKSKRAGKTFIPESWLIKDSFNTLLIKFENRYYRDGEGLHTYVDTDGKQYIYTETEPFLQHRVMPCFDQPDLKGTFKRYFSCPEEWEVITTEASEFECKVSNLASHPKEFVKAINQEFPSIDGNKKFYEFLISKPLPTYLNSVFAGCYYRFDLEESKRLDGLPMAVYCRETLKEFVEHQLDDIFEYHKQAVRYYSDFFQFKYPFSKCDAIYCPEYRMGAMEYPGGITYSEYRYLYRTKTPSAGEKSERGRVILHEMAHMWYGDTVTMKWWDGLWLNESFADFCCFEAWSGIQDDMSFDIYDGKVAFLNRKQWGYREDVMITTHPIQHTVVDTLAAENIFDGITYPKGAACIKQLMTVLGEAKFKAAMVEYFKRYAWKNTTLADLINCCQEQVAEEIHPIYDLDQWNKSHLQTAGLNWVKAEWNPEIKGQAKMVIKQGSVLPQHPTLRYHKMGIAFVDKEGKILEEKMIIVENKSETIIEYNGDLKTAAVLLNHGDQAFVRVILDNNTQDFLLSNLLKLERIMDRGLFLKYINDSVKACILPTKSYFPFILDYIKKEQNPQLLQFVITELIEMFNLLPKSDYKKQVFSILVSKLSNPEEKFEGDMIAMLFGSLISLADDDDSIDVLKRVVDRSSEVHHIKNFGFSLNQHWNIIFLCQASSKYTPEQKKELIDNLAASDKTDSKTEWQLKIKGLVTRGEERQKLIESILDPKDLSYKEIEHLCVGLTSRLVPAEEKEKYFAYYFDHFLAMFRSLNANYAKTIRVYLMPSSSAKNDYILERLNAIVAQTTEIEAALKKSLLMVVDTTEKKKKLYEFNTAEGQKN